MFVEKNTKKITDKIGTQRDVKVVVEDNETHYVQEVVRDANPLCDVFVALKSILSEIPNPNNPSEPLFKTIKIDNGQLGRIKNQSHNLEYALAFPAVFIHFINVRYLVKQNRVGEGRCTCRIHYVLNRLNNSDEGFEMEGYEIFQLINVAIQKNKEIYPALTERFSLQYFEQPDSFNNGLQPFWIDYEVWFHDYSTYRYKEWVERYVVMPPFTNHSDQNEEANANNLPNYNTPDYDDASGFNK